MRWMRPSEQWTILRSKVHRVRGRSLHHPQGGGKSVLLKKKEKKKEEKKEEKQQYYLPKNALPHILTGKTWEFLFTILANTTWPLCTQADGDWGIGIKIRNDQPGAEEKQKKGPLGWMQHPHRSVTYQNTCRSPPTGPPPSPHSTTFANSTLSQDRGLIFHLHFRCKIQSFL